MSNVKENVVEEIKVLENLMKPLENDPVLLRTQNSLLMNALIIGGGVFMFAALIALATLTYRLATLKIENDFKLPDGITDPSSQSAMVFMIDHYLTVLAPTLLLLIAAIVASAIGYFLFKTAGSSTRETIPVRDSQLLYKMLLDNNEEGINQYVRLNSLTGITGTFTQIGLAGLPLATIALTIFFAVLSLLGNKDLFDLAKLTLGAFIGSYVQREVTLRNIKNDGSSNSKNGTSDSSATS